MRTLNRLTMLNAIFSSFQMTTQSPHESDKYFNEATALIEVLEIVDCGSVGGFDRDNPHKRVTGCPPYDRFLTLLRKEQNAGKIKPICGADVNTLTEYFEQLMALRSKVYNEFPA